MVGPITAKAEPDPLPLDMANIINSSRGHGFIIASFGSYAETIISNKTFDIMAAAFGKLKQKVIWKLKGIFLVLIVNYHQLLSRSSLSSLLLLSM